MRILVVEDDKDVSELLVRLLKRHNYIVDNQYNLELAYEALRNSTFDLVILDRNLPDGDGLSLIKLLREELTEDKLPPFIVLSALSDLSDRVLGLDSGAVDYIVKPYEPEALLARVRVRLRHGKPTTSSIIPVGNGEYDMFYRSYKVDGQVVAMRRRELIIFDLLVKNFGQVVVHRRIDDAVYGYDDEIASNSLSSHISRLRKVLKDSKSGLSLIVMRHIGYMLKDQN